MSIFSVCVLLHLSGCLSSQANRHWTLSSLPMKNSAFLVIVFITCFFILYSIQFVLLIPVFCSLQDIYSFTYPFYTCGSVFHREYQNNSLLNSSFCFQCLQADNFKEDLQSDWLEELFLTFPWFWSSPSFASCCAWYMYRYYWSIC